MGHQQTIEEMRAEKAQKYIELKDKKDSKEYQEWFLRYRPLDNQANNTQVRDALNIKKVVKQKKYQQKIKPKTKSFIKSKTNKKKLTVSKKKKTTKKKRVTNKKKKPSSTTKSSSPSSKKTIIIKI
jgi:hypothetical protein